MQVRQIRGQCGHPIKRCQGIAQRSHHVRQSVCPMLGIQTIRHNTRPAKTPAGTIQSAIDNKPAQRSRRLPQ